MAELGINSCSKVRCLQEQLSEASEASPPPDRKTNDCWAPGGDRSPNEPTLVAHCSAFCSWFCSCQGVVCMVEPRRYAFTPCGHRCVCHLCAVGVTHSDRRCPICRTKASKLWEFFAPKTKSENKKTMPCQVVRILRIVDPWKPSLSSLGRYPHRPCKQWDDVMVGP